MKKSSQKKSGLQLPVQVLQWKSIKDTEILLKIFLQFDIKLDQRGRKVFSLVAYPAYRDSKTDKLYFGKKIPLTVKRPLVFRELKLPVTLGNLEITHAEIIEQIKPTEKTRLIFTPNLFKANPHAGYLVTDDSGQGRVAAKPSPPAPPEAA